MNYLVLDRQLRGIGIEGAGVEEGIDQLVLALELDELLSAGEQLAHALLPLPSVPHLVVLVHLLEDRLAVQALRVHLQDLNGLPEEGLLRVHVDILAGLHQLLQLGCDGGGGTAQLLRERLQDGLAEDNVGVDELLEGLSLLAAPPLPLLPRAHCIGALALGLRGLRLGLLQEPLSELGAVLPDLAEEVLEGLHPEVVDGCDQLDSGPRVPPARHQEAAEATPELLEEGGVVGNAGVVPKVLVEGVGDGPVDVDGGEYLLIGLGEPLLQGRDAILQLLLVGVLALPHEQPLQLKAVSPAVPQGVNRDALQKLA